MKLSYCPNVDDATAPVVSCDFAALPPAVDEYQMYAGQVTPNYKRTEAVGVSPVNPDAISAAHGYERMNEAGLDLVVETPSSKGWDTTGAKSREWALQQMQFVKERGGSIAAFTLDEPLTGTPVELPELADTTAKMVRLCRENGVACYLIEAFPHNSVKAILDFVRALKERDALPDRFVSDIWYPNGVFDTLGYVLKLSGLNTALHDLGVQETAGIVCGHGDMVDQAAYATAAYQMARFWKKVSGVDRLVVQSWHNLKDQDRDTTFLTVPACCPQDDPTSHRAILKGVSELFDWQPAWGPA